jgi:hypothetical protein
MTSMSGGMYAMEEGQSHFDSKFVWGGGGYSHFTLLGDSQPTTQGEIPGRTYWMVGPKWNHLKPKLKAKGGPRPLESSLKYKEGRSRLNPLNREVGMFHLKPPWS